MNKVQKRRRQNARFRKLLIPKNAIMVLNELNPGCAFETDEQTNAFAQTCYTVRCTVSLITMLICSLLLKNVIDVSQ